MNNIKVRTPFNREEHITKGKVFTMPSMTIPDQSMSIKTLMEKYARGMDLGGITKKELWDDDNDQMGINAKTLDLADIELMRKKNAENIKEKTDAIEKEQERRKLKEAEKQWKKEQAAEQAIGPIPGDSLDKGDDDSGKNRSAK